jgi:hypothetical protein
MRRRRKKKVWKEDDQKPTLKEIFFVQQTTIRLGAKQAYRQAYRTARCKQQKLR